MVSCSSQPSHGLSTTSRRSSAFSVMRTLAACFSVRLTRQSRWALSLSGAFFFAVRAPTVAHERCSRARPCSRSRSDA
jgi:hypothetical protein